MEENLIQKPISFSAETVHWLEEQAKAEEASIAFIVRQAVRHYRKSIDAL